MTEPCVDHDDICRSIRIKWLEIDPSAAFMSIDDRKDFYDGLCRIRTFEGQVILDYTRPWGTARG